AAELRRRLVAIGIQSLVVRDLARGREWRGAELSELLDHLRRLEDAVERAIPSWTRLEPKALFDTFDGQALRAWWAQARGQDHFFESKRELDDFLELERLAVKGHEPLAIYSGPESSTSRDAAHVASLRLPFTEELAALLR